MPESILKQCSIASAVAMALALPVEEAVAGQMFLDIPGAEGESQDESHKNEIDVLSWSWGMTLHSSGVAGGDRQQQGPCVGDMTITKFHDASSADLYQALSNGRRFNKATLTVRKAGDQPLEYVVIEMEDILITSVNTGSSADEALVTENVSLNFAKVEGTYIPQESDGSAGPAEHWIVQPGKCQ